MSKYIKITLVFTLISTLISAVAFHFADKEKLNNMSWSHNFESYWSYNSKDEDYVEFEGKQDIDVSKDDEFSVFTVAGTVNVLKSKDNKAHLYIKTKVKQGRDVTINNFFKVDGHEKIIYLAHSEKDMAGRNHFSGSYNLKELGEVMSNSKSAEIVLELPINIKSINVNGVNADVTVKDLNFEKTAINVISGDVNLTNMVSPRLEVNSVSGDVNCDSCSVDKVDLNTASGDIDFKIKDESDYRVDFSSISGDFTGEKRKNSKSSKYFTVNTVSGDFNLN